MVFDFHIDTVMLLKKAINLRMIYDRMMKRKRWRTWSVADADPNR